MAKTNRNLNGKVKTPLKYKMARKKSRSSSSIPEDIKINLPFPPQVKIEKFFPSKYSVSLRTLNSFIIYRKVVTAEIKKSHNLCWSEISTIASKKWSLEDANVKQHYRDLAEKAKALYRSKHLFYVHHGHNAIESIMCQDNNETAPEKSPKTFIFVNSEYENKSLNDSNNEVAGQQSNDASDEQTQGDQSDIEMSNNDNYQNESEQNIPSSSDTALSLESLNIILNTHDFSMSALLHNDEMIYSILFPQDVEMENNNMSGFEAQGFP